MTKNGWIYCMSNPSMPGVFKIGMTVRTPEERLAEANNTDTWRPPTDYVIEYSVPVNDAFNIERIIHAQLEEYGHRIHPRREFFKTSLSTIKSILDAVKADSTPPVLVITEKESDRKHLVLRSGRILVR
jgi:hypothetical protein